MEPTLKRWPFPEEFVASSSHRFVVLLLDLSINIRSPHREPPCSSVCSGFKWSAELSTDLPIGRARPERSRRSSAAGYLRY